MAWRQAERLGQIRKGLLLFVLPSCAGDRFPPRHRSGQDQDARPTLDNAVGREDEDSRQG